MLLSEGACQNKITYLMKECWMLNDEETDNNLSSFIVCAFETKQSLTLTKEYLNLAINFFFLKTTFRK